MATMRFSAVARLNIMGILNEKAKGKGHEAGYKTSADLYDKIAFTDQQQEEELSIKLDGVPTLNPGLIRAYPVLEEDLNYEELAKLSQVLKEFDIRPVDRRTWYADIHAQLEAAKDPPQQDQATKDRQLTEFRSQNKPKSVGRAG